MVKEKNLKGHLQFCSFQVYVDHGLIDEFLACLASFVSIDVIGRGPSSHDTAMLVSCGFTFNYDCYFCLVLSLGWVFSRSICEVKGCLDSCFVLDWSEDRGMGIRYVMLGQ